jgi:hypothetical protein
MSIVGELLQRWRLRTDSRPTAPVAAPAPAAQDAAPTDDARSAPRSEADPAPAGAPHESCRLCGKPLRDDDVVAVHAADVVHSDCYDDSLDRDLR